jgi:hypothetical protein
MAPREVRKSEISNGETKGEQFLQALTSEGNFGYAFESALRPRSSAACIMNTGWRRRSHGGYEYLRSTAVAHQEDSHLYDPFTDCSHAALRGRTSLSISF